LSEVVYFYALLAVTWSLQRRSRRRHVMSWRQHQHFSLENENSKQWTLYVS